MIGPWTTDPNQLDGMDLALELPGIKTEAHLPGLFCDCVR